MSTLATGALVAMLSTAEILRQSRESIREHESKRGQLSDEGSLARLIGQLQRENDQLKLHVACLISLLIRKNVIGREEFGKLSAIIDRADGVEDGRFSGEIRADGALTAEAEADDLALRELAKVVQGLK